MKYLLWMLGFLLCVSSAHAQQACFPRAPFVAMLAAQYGEYVIFEALMEPEGGRPTPIIMFASPLGRTWTMVSNVNPAILCPILKGSAFEPPSPDKAEAPPA